MRAMKDSGVPWIGNIPEDWQLVSVKRLFSIGRGRVIAQSELNETGYPVYSSQTKDNGCLGYIDTYDYDYPQLTWTTDGANAGSIFLRTGYYNCTNVCGTLNPTDDLVDLRYQKYALEHIAYNERRIDTNGYKIMNNEMAIIKTLLPPLSIQHQIADYLDIKCTQIDTIIAKEQSVIEKLQDYRQSIITETVTSGLDSTTNLVFSGVEWIAKIPLNWKITRFTKSFEFFKGLNIKKTDLVDSGAGVVSYGQVHAKNNNGYSLQADIIRYVAENLIDEKSLLQEGDFVFADTSEDLEGVGNCIHIDSSNELYAGYHTLVARCLDESICTKYLAFLFLTDIWRSQLRKNANGTKVYSITQKMFKAVSCLVPPIEEQLKIVAYLEQKCDFIDKVISHKLTIIDTLIEYKKSLIYEVVTGKKEIPHV